MYLLSYDYRVIDPYLYKEIGQLFYGDTSHKYSSINNMLKLRLGGTHGATSCQLSTKWDP
uniref:Uncharacterized protein n=1 Tax=Rhizophora mucronata TaxID=61149 RepID=A0A2P2N3A9_RHIMU